MNTEVAWEVIRSTSVPQDHSAVVHERGCHVRLAAIDNQSGVALNGGD